MKPQHPLLVVMIGLLSVGIAACGSNGQAEELDVTVQAAIQATETAESEFNAEVAAAVEATNLAAQGAPAAAESAPGKDQTGQGAESDVAEDHNLLIAKNGDDSLFVVNISAESIPLAGLRLGDGGSAITGASWGLESLESSGCVTAWKEKGNPEPPVGLSCIEVGERLTRGGPDLFWRSDFNVYYNGGQVGICLQSESQCSFKVEY